MKGKFDDDFAWTPIEGMSDQQVREELQEARTRFEVLEKDLSK
jgi:hypothetical protein